MDAFILWLQNHGTKALGVLSGTLTTLVATGIIPPTHVPYYMAAISLLTYWRGMSNSNAVITTQAAKAIIEKEATK